MRLSNITRLSDWHKLSETVLWKFGLVSSGKLVLAVVISYHSSAFGSRTAEVPPPQGSFGKTLA